MADDIDRASDLEQRRRDDALKNIGSLDREGPQRCIRPGCNNRDWRIRSGYAVCADCFEEDLGGGA